MVDGWMLQEGTVEGKETESRSGVQALATLTRQTMQNAAENEQFVISHTYTETTQPKYLAVCKVNEWRERSVRTKKKVVVKAGPFFSSPLRIYYY